MVWDFRNIDLVLTKVDSLHINPVSLEINKYTVDPKRFLGKSLVLALLDRASWSRVEGSCPFL